MGRAKRSVFLVDAELARKIWKIERELEKSGRYTQMRVYIHHGNTTVFAHCLRVALLSCIIARWIGMRVNDESLIRGALLHDYYLYDWHEKDSSHRLHGFRHPQTALRNALENYQLEEVEKQIIVRHMFPLTILPPSSAEGWIVCAADKVCALQEVWAAWGKRNSRCRR